MSNDPGIDYDCMVDEIAELKRKIEILESWIEGEGVDPEGLYEGNRRYIEEGR